MKTDGIAAVPAPRAAPHRVSAATYIAFDELSVENWAIPGKLLDEELTEAR